MYNPYNALKHSEIYHRSNIAYTHRFMTITYLNAAKRNEQIFIKLLTYVVKVLTQIK